MTTAEPIGEPFRCEELDAATVLAGLGRYAIAAHDPPWPSLAANVPPPVRVIAAGNMELDHLEHVAAQDPDESDVIVGLGGGTALDTAKFVAWRTGKRLIQIPTITSVDAGFTDAVGVRQQGRVRYVGKIVPEMVVLDIALVRTAPARLNRAGIGDVLSCHTGLFDWRLATDVGQGHPWRDALARLARSLLADLEAALADINAVSADGVRFLAGAYRLIGAACAAAGHSRFEEGSEHFWAYAYEAATGAHHIHGELIAFATAAMAHVQGNEPTWVTSVIERSGARAHPDDLGISRRQFSDALTGLAHYARAEALDISVVDLHPVSADDVEAAWAFTRSLPRVPD